MIEFNACSASLLQIGDKYVSKRRGEFWITVERITYGDLKTTITGVNAWGEVVTERYSHREILNLVKGN